jgi:hypothetical protein
MFNHSEFAGFILANERMKSAERPTNGRAPRPATPSGLDYRGSLHRSALALSIKACALWLSSVLFIGVAAAQTPYEPIVNGRQLQPTSSSIARTIKILSSEISTGFAGTTAANQKTIVSTRRSCARRHHADTSRRSVLSL